MPLLTLRDAGRRFLADGFLTAVVPEPETYALMLTGLAFLGFMTRRRQEPVKREW